MTFQIVGGTDHSEKPVIVERRPRKRAAKARAPGEQVSPAARHAEAFVAMEWEVCDLDRAGEIARDLIMNCSVKGKDSLHDLELAVFAVGQFAEMAKAFRANYYKRYDERAT